MDFTNGQALKASIEAVRRTDKAESAKITHELGAVAQAVSFRQLTRGKSKGQWRTKRGAFVMAGKSLASRILGARFAKTGSFGGVKGKTDEDRVQNLIKLRVRSRSFIAAGWIGARNSLFSLVKQKPAKMRSIADAKQYGKPKGSAVPARFSLKHAITAGIVNTALLPKSKDPSKPRDPMRTAVKGLQAALNETARDMLAELARRLQPDFKRVSTK